jgi:hypothetical protein
VEAAANMMIKRLSWLNVDTQAKLDCGRQYNLKEGLDTRYGVFGGDSKNLELLNDPAYTRSSCIKHLFLQLRLAQENVETEEENHD